MDFKYLGCRITLDGKKWYCDSFRTRKKNLHGAWMKAWIDYGGEFLPDSAEDFYRRGGKIEWYTSH